MATKKSSISSQKIISFLKKNRPTIIVVLIGLLLFDVFANDTSSDIITFGLLILFILGIIFLKFTSRLTFFITLTMAIIMSISYIFMGTTVITEKAAVWLFLFLLVGVFQQWRE